MAEFVTAVAHSNIALAKYWGKRQVQGNLPAVGSLSMTLSGLYTRTSVRLNPSLNQHTIWVVDAEAPNAFAERSKHFIDTVRQMVDSDAYVEVRTENTFPTGAGLASSASGFAALALATTEAYGVKLSPRELSGLARTGSGSASRSLFGGFVEWHRGALEDGSDSVAEPIAGPDHWDVRMLVVITSEAEKQHSSTDGMNLTRDTSPYYDAWLSTSPQTLKDMKAAVLARNFDRVGELTESSCLQMHAVMLSARPGLLYWNPATVALIHAVRAERAAGLGCYFTIDAGPQVKILCRPEHVERLRERIENVPGVIRILEAAPGPDARVERA
ncbi:MAG: diphosphomevalonate decarboxylase [Myxococcota bacterium]